MKRVLARATPFRGQLAVDADDAVADGALALALERARHVLAPGDQTVDDGAQAAARGREGDDALGGDEPAAPLLLVDGDAVDGFDGRGGERIGGREGDADAHDLLVDGVRGGDGAAGKGDFDLRGLVGGGLSRDPVVDCFQLRVDDQGRDLRLVSSTDKTFTARSRSPIWWSILPLVLAAVVGTRRGTMLG